MGFSRQEYWSGVPLLLGVTKSLLPFNIPLGCFQILAPFYKKSLGKLFVSLYIMHLEVTELRLQPWSFNSRTHVFLWDYMAPHASGYPGHIAPQSSCPVLQPTPENYSLLVSHVPMSTHIAGFPLSPFLLSHHHHSE